MFFLKSNRKREKITKKPFYINYFSFFFLISLYIIFPPVPASGDSNITQFFYFPFSQDFYQYNKTNNSSVILKQTKFYFLKDFLKKDNFIYFCEVKGKSKILEKFDPENSSFTTIYTFDCDSLLIGDPYIISISYDQYSQKNNGFQYLVYQLKGQDKIIPVGTYYLPVIANDYAINSKYIYISGDTPDSKYNTVYMIDQSAQSVWEILYREKDSSFLKIIFYDPYLLVNISYTGNNSEKNNEINCFWTFDENRLDNSKFKIYKKIKEMEKTGNKNPGSLSAQFTDFFKQFFIKNFQPSHFLYGKGFILGDKLFLQAMDKEFSPYFYSFPLGSITKPADNQNKQIEIISQYHKIEYTFYSPVFRENGEKLFYISYNYYRDRTNFYFCSYSSIDFSTKLLLKLTP